MNRFGSNHFGSFARALSVLWMSLFALALVACSTPTPEDVVRDFYKAVAGNRIDEAVGYFSLVDVKENDMAAAKGKLQMIAGELSSRIATNDGLDSVTTTVVEQTDETARVKVELKFKNGKTLDESHDLVKDSGKWKIELGGTRARARARE